MILRPSHIGGRGEQRSTLGRRGGTLLEVLVSLVILAMLIRVALQVSAGVRGARRLADDAAVGSGAAMEWRLARMRGETWAQGEDGSFPFAERAMSWRLARPAVQSLKSEVDPDDAWRTLEIRRAEGISPLWSAVLRLADLQADEEVAETSKESPA